MSLQKTLSFFDKLKRLKASTRYESGLTELLSEGSRASDFHERLYWFQDILMWLRKDQGLDHKDENGNETSVRFRYLFRTLEKNPNWQANLRDNFEALVSESEFWSFFAQTGYSTEHGLWSDIFSRLAGKVFPRAGKRDFQILIRKTFTDEEDVAWLKSLSIPVLQQLKEAFVGSPKVWQILGTRLKADLESAILIITAHISHHGLSDGIRARIKSRIDTNNMSEGSSSESIGRSSFLNLSVGVQQLFHQEHRSLDQKQAKLFESNISLCRQDIDMVYEHMEKSGVSVAVVHKLEVLTALLDRLQLLLKLDLDKPENERLQDIKIMMIAASNSSIRAQSVIGHIKHHFYLLSRKIVERNGSSGEHYIARNATEQKSFLKSAFWGGIIVVFMTILKTLLIRTEPAPLFLAIGSWFIYSAGFLVMQFTGSTLATKIPSFTASHLAKILKSVRKIDTADLNAEIRQVVKSQAVALLGNFLGVIPFALLLGLAATTLFGHTGLMDDHYATHIVQDINPIFSVAILWGALTGAELWASSVCGGWFENWVVFNGIPETLEHHPRLKSIFGRDFAFWLSKKTLAHSSGVATNISLGFLFGFVPLLGTLFGLNLSGHHVTISTAAATFATSELNFQLSAWEWVATITGLILIGIMNFTVSFSLAMAVAANAQKMNLRRVWSYLRAKRN